MSLEQQILKAENELSKLDLKMGDLIKKQKTVIHEPRADYFASLSRSIIGQQVSVAAAKAILGRFELKTALDPKKVQQLTDEECKAIGLSKQKSNYLRDLAVHFAKEPAIYNHLENLNDSEIIEELTEIKGIGIWTAQMFLMFSLSRLDVFPVDDVGVQNGMKLFFNWENIPSKNELVTCAEKWRPYRTVACWHLWESLKNSPV